MPAPAPQFGAGNVTTAAITSGTSLTANKPALIADGDLLVAIPWTHKSATTWSVVPSGWASLGPVQSAVGTVGAWSKPIPSAAAESASNYTWTWSSGSDRGAIVIFRVTGARLGQPEDAAGTYVTTGSSSIVAPAMTAVDAAALLIAIFMTNTGTATPAAITAPGSMTEIANVTANTGAATSVLEICAQTLSASGTTGTRTAAVAPNASSAAGGLFTIQPPATGSVALTGVGTLSAAGNLGASGDAALTGAGTLTAAGKMAAFGAVDLAGVGTLAVDSTSPNNVLLSDGTWAAVTKKVLNDAGTWVP